MWRHTDVEGTVHLMARLVETDALLTCPWPRPFEAVQIDLGQSVHIPSGQRKYTSQIGRIYGSNQPLPSAYWTLQTGMGPYMARARSRFSSASLIFIGSMIVTTGSPASPGPTISFKAHLLGFRGSPVFRHAIQRESQPITRRRRCSNGVERHEQHIPNRPDSSW